MTGLNKYNKSGIQLKQLIEDYQENIAKILPFEFIDENTFKLDLSINNLDLLSYDNLSTRILTKYINDNLTKYGKQIAVGGYGENRVIYQKSELFGNSENARSVHLGIDVWCNENTPISAPMDSIIHSFKDNDNFGDYGPTIILEHSIKSQVFYTLYGHLAKSSISDIGIGDKINKGEVFAKVGNSLENGNWPSHLHFQLITDTMDYFGDFPGVSSEKEKVKWLDICPNPSLLLLQTNKY